MEACAPLARIADRQCTMIQDQTLETMVYVLSLSAVVLIWVYHSIERNRMLKRD